MHRKKETRQTWTVNRKTKRKRERQKTFMDRKRKARKNKTNTQIDRERHIRLFRFVFVCIDRAQQFGQEEGGCKIMTSTIKTTNKSESCNFGQKKTFPFFERPLDMQFGSCEKNASLVTLLLLERQCYLSYITISFIQVLCANLCFYLKSSMKNNKLSRNHEEFWKIVTFFKVQNVLRLYLK